MALVRAAGARRAPCDRTHRRIPAGQDLTGRVRWREHINARNFATTALALGALIPFHALADDDISATYKLIIEQRKIVDTGETVPVPNPLGYITYGKDGRVLVVIVRHPRPKPEAIDKITDQERIDLFRTMTAYGGTYKFDGKTVEYSIDIAWNEVWAGTKQVRTVTREGDLLTLTTPPFPFHTDGKISVNMLVFEKVN
jgi:hypothetical protein